MKSIEKNLINAQRLKVAEVNSQKCEKMRIKKLFGLKNVAATSHAFTE